MSSSKATFAAAGAIMVAIVAAYSNAWSGPFVFDDLPAIVENSTIRDFRSAWFPPSDRGLPVTGRPVVNLSLAINYAIGGLDPRGYHVTNILFHAGVALLLLGVVRRTFQLLNGSRRDGTIAAWAIAGLWALHPLQTAAVTYTIQRAEILVSFFYLLTLYGLIRAVESREAPAARSLRRLGWLIVSVVACAAGMATKEVMVSAPLMAFLYDYAFVTTSLRESWRKRGGYFVALGATWLVLGALMWQTGTRAGTAGFGLGVSSGAYALKQCEALVHYLSLTVWPTSLVFDYGGMVLAPRITDVLPQLLLLTLAVTAVVVAWWKWPKAGFVGTWFFALLAPTSSFVPLADTMFEHRPYLALAAVMAGGVWLLQRVAGGRATTVFVALACGFGVLTAKRNSTYRAEISLWQDTVTKRPESVRGRYTLGAALFAAGRVGEALEQYGEALRLAPDSTETHNNLGNALMRMGRAAEAKPHYEAALQRRPSAETFNNYGNALMRLGESSAAREQYEAALRLRPEFADAHNNLGNALAQAGDLARAAQHYAAALQANPNFADAHANLGNVRAQNGQLGDAIAHYQAALRLRPNFADAHYNLATALAQQRRWREAIAHYTTVLELRPDYPGARENLERVRIYQDVLGK